MPALGAAWPAWRAGRREVVQLLRGADVSAARAGAAASGLRAAGLATLGARLVGARRVRLIATATHARPLDRVRAADARARVRAQHARDRSQRARQALSAHGDAAAVRSALASRGSPGCRPQRHATRLEAADAFALGETINVIAFPGDHTTFEAPPLVSGRRLRGPRETEVGQGLAQALGLTEGSMLALALPVRSGSSDCASSGSSARCSTTAASPTSRHPRC